VAYFFRPLCIRCGAVGQCSQCTRHRRTTAVWLNVLRLSASIVVNFILPYLGTLVVPVTSTSDRAVNSFQSDPVPVDRYLLGTHSCVIQQWVRREYAVAAFSPVFVSLFRLLYSPRVDILTAHSNNFVRVTGRRFSADCGRCVVGGGGGVGGRSASQRRRRPGARPGSVGRRRPGEPRRMRRRQRGRRPVGGGRSGSVVGGRSVVGVGRVVWQQHRHRLLPDITICACNARMDDNNDTLQYRVVQKIWHILFRTP